MQICRWQLREYGIRLGFLPIWNHPSSSITCLVWSGLLRYPFIICGPLAQISPFWLAPSVAPVLTSITYNTGHMIIIQITWLDLCLLIGSQCSTSSDIYNQQYRSCDYWLISHWFWFFKKITCKINWKSFNHFTLISWLTITVPADPGTQLAVSSNVNIPEVSVEPYSCLSTRKHVKLSFWTFVVDALFLHVNRGSVVNIKQLILLWTHFSPGKIGSEKLHFLWRRSSVGMESKVCENLCIFTMCHINLTCKIKPNLICSNQLFSFVIACKLCGCDLSNHLIFSYW